VTKRRNSQTAKQAFARRKRISQAAEQERKRIMHQDILGKRQVHLFPLDEAAAERELSRFTKAIWSVPRMRDYFDRRHLANLRGHLREAQDGFVTLASGGVLEILVIPTLPEDAMGFHILSVFDPKDSADKGKYIGYTIWSLEKGGAPYGRAEAVRMAFDIFPPFREGRYRKVPFTNHEIYNVSRRVLYHFRPERFLVDAKTQISQTHTGEPVKRTAYYLKRGYYPPDQKPLADAYLMCLARGRNLGERSVRRLLKQSRSIFWVYPVGKYVRRTLEIET